MTDTFRLMLCETMGTSMPETSLLTLSLLLSSLDGFDSSFPKLIGPGLSYLGSESSESSLIPLSEAMLLERQENLLLLTSDFWGALC